MERTVYDSFLSYHTRRILIVIWIIFGLGGSFVSLIAFGVMMFGGTNEIWAMICGVWIVGVVCLAVASWLIMCYATIIGGLWEIAVEQYYEFKKEYAKLQRKE